MNRLMSMAIRGYYYVTLSYICSLQLVTNQSYKIVLTARTNCARKRMVSEHHSVERSAHSAPVSGSATYHLMLSKSYVSYSIENGLKPLILASTPNYKSN